MGFRDDFYRTLNHEKPKEIPFDLRLCDSLMKILKEKGSDDPSEYFQSGFRRVTLKPTEHPNDYTPYFEGLGRVDKITEWGLGLRGGSMYHFTSFIAPMQKFTSPEEVWNFPLPDVMADYRWEGFDDNIKRLKEQDFITMNDEDSLGVDIFEPAWYVRGLDNMLVDMKIDPDMATACLDRMLDIRCKMVERLGKAKLDVLLTGDDVGTERGMMMDPELWREWLKPRLKKLIETAKSAYPEMKVFYHSDGVIYDIIDDLIEVGVDILNPIQPECMDPVLLKEKYGDKLSFWGCIGTQTTMPFGTPEEVTKVVNELIEKVGYNGGLILAPTHMLMPEVPWENIEAFVNAVKSHK